MPPMLLSPLLAALVLGDPIPVAVDPRVELLSIVFRLGGCFEFVQDVSRSPYADEVEAWFGPLRDHDAVARAKLLRAEHGIGFNAVPDLAVHLSTPPDLALRVPLEPHPERLDQRWRGVDLEGFLASLRKFERESRFGEFTAAHGGLYQESARRLQALIETSGVRAWVDGFFAVPAGTAFTAIPGLLQGGANYGCSVRLPDGRLELSPAFGVWEWDEQGLPVFGEGHVPVLAHEFTHAFANPVIDAHWSELEPALVRVFERVRATMEALAYPDPKIMAQESLVRACVVRFAAAIGGPEKAREQAQEEAGVGFTWAPGLAELLAEYERDRARYPTLDAFAPRLAGFFEGVAEELEALAEKAPKVLVIEPANGAREVDPGTSEIRVTFDRPMLDGSWAVVGGGPEFPEAAGEPSFDEARRVFTFPVKLAPGRTYSFGLNGPLHRGFVGEDGTALEPVQVSFSTRP